MKLKSIYLAILFMLFSLSNIAQDKKMDYKTFDIWNTIEKEQISNNGDWVTYVLKPGKGDPTLKIYNTRSKKTYSFYRADSPKIDFNSEFIAFVIHPQQKLVEDLKRKKTKKKDLPSDTLAIFHCENQKLDKISDLEKFELPEKWGGYILYQTNKNAEPIDSTTIALDTLKIENKPNNKSRKQSEVNGFDFTIRAVNNNLEQTIPFVKSFCMAKRQPIISWHSTGTDTLESSSIAVMDILGDSIYDINRDKGEYKSFSFSEDGEHLAYLINKDTTDALIPPFELQLWNKKSNSTSNVSKHIITNHPDQWILSQYYKPTFSENGNTLFFGTAPVPLVQDTTKLDSEIVHVEIWNYQDPLLYTQQNVETEKENKRSYLASYNIENKNIVHLGNKNIPEIITDRKKEQGTFIGYNNKPYQKYLSWEGHDYKDIYTINSTTGESKKILSRIHGNVNYSPSGQYIYWYSRPDSVWQVYNLESELKYDITNKNKIHCFDELNDRPMDAYPYGYMSWSDDDTYFYINDRYDIWKIDPSGVEEPIKLTNGRDSKIKYRYVRLDKELQSIPQDTNVVLHFHNENTKGEGYVSLDVSNGDIKTIQSGEYKFTRNILKAKLTNDIIFTKESFQQFPDLIHSSDLSFHKLTTFTTANPQQEDYGWGDISIIKWISPTGDSLSGLLVLPPDFKPKKKYPLIVNFYERNSQNLNRHRAPYPHRSTINYSYYSNKGYVIFNPDIVYRVGEPGESCYDAVTSGVEALLEQGFIDKDRMGVQGHSWGGYQIAHLITRTDMFRCAEAGAPVVNMVSAYGGIRWRTGRSRMFQYEHTQSRLGGTLWNNPEAYLANSPIFNMDKVNTPVLIMHNDKDGAVPWYQGIEMFVALRRLGKKAWMLNYNDEPHWPVKRQNRIDFNRRLEQFFDHYLFDEDAPIWMEQSMPAIEKGINLGY